jgi:hypothetical protein
MTGETGETKTVRVHLRIDSEGDATALTEWDMQNGTSLEDGVSGDLPHQDYVIEVRVPIPTALEAKPADAVVELTPPEPSSAPAITATQVA